MAIVPADNEDIDEDIIAQIVAEAEAGYEPHQLKRQGQRPPMVVCVDCGDTRQVPPDIANRLSLPAGYESKGLCTSCRLKRQPSFVCPTCGARSFNPNDIAQEYCGRCHDWTGLVIDR